VHSRRRSGAESADARGAAPGHLDNDNIIIIIIVIIIISSSSSISIITAENHHPASCPSGQYSWTIT
jgi:hypothetical protein